MGVYHPRMAAKLWVTAAGTPTQRVAQELTEKLFELNLRPVRVRLVSNNHNEADEVEITVLHDEAGIDPRFLRSSILSLYIGEANDSGDFVPTYETLRFEGIVRDAAREFAESGGKTVTLRAIDYTTLFLEMKNFPESGRPLFSDTLPKAWERICKSTGYYNFDTNPPEIDSSVSLLADQLDLSNVDPKAAAKTIGSTLPARVERLGKPHVNGAADAWGVWQEIVSSLGLISFIRGNRCIVTTATDYYTANDPPRLIWGKNILELKESRDLGSLSAKNVCARSYDPLTGNTLESYFPPPDRALRVKKLGAKPAKNPPKTIKTQDYELFDLPFAVPNQATLDAVASRIWEERTRQELKGELTTAEMRVDTAQGESFDLLKLQSGDQIEIQIERDGLGEIQALPTLGERSERLRELGYSDDMVRYVVNNLDALTRLPRQFLVQTVATDFELSAGGGSYQVRITFVNRIHLSGAALGEGTGTSKTPMAGQKPASKSAKTGGKPPAKPAGPAPKGKLITANDEAEDFEP